MAVLSCGGRGPCCHVGYAHRHCEHCDVVIPYSYTWPPPGWYSGAYYGNTSGLLAGLQQSLLTGQPQSRQTYGTSTIVDVHTHEEGN